MSDMEISARRSRSREGNGLRGQSAKGKRSGLARLELVWVRLTLLCLSSCSNAGQ